MSETTNNNTPVTVLTLEQKQANWSKFAVEVHQTEMRLQAVKESLIAKIKEAPIDTTKIESYEVTLKDFKAGKAQLSEDRKALTNKLDKLKERLMIPEKELEGPQKDYETTLLSTKQAKRTADEVIIAKSAELARVKEFFANSIAQQHADFEILIINKAAKAYEHALTKKLSTEQLKDVWPTITTLLTVADFITKQLPVSVVYMKPEEITAIYEGIHQKNAKTPSEYVEKYQSLLKEKFEFYEIALKNSEASLELEKKNQAEALTNVANEAADAVVAAKLEAISNPETVIGYVVNGGKALKQVYKLDMEETQQNAIAIIAAFAANWSTVKDELGVKKWFNLSVKQMADGLVSLKNKDNRFEVSGIKFKLEDKL